MILLSPNFGNEVIAAGLGGLPFAWGNDGDDIDMSLLTSDQASILRDVIEAHDPKKQSTQTSILSQDLMAQFTTDDLIKIKAAVEANIQFWGLWSAMQAQKDPMVLTNERFLMGWDALVQVLGQTRMDDVATALSVKVTPL